MTVPRSLFAGPGARRALGDGARGEVAVAFSGGGAYVRLGRSEWVLLARPDVPFGPLSVAIEGLDCRSLEPGAPVEVTRGLLLVDDRAVSLERMRVRPCTAERAGAVVALASSASPPAALDAGLAALASGRVADGVALLAGLGEGLTPAGDDVLAGYAVGRLALGRPVAISAMASGRSSPIGLAYLRCAERGELPDAPLRSWGASSGVAIAWGINAAAAQLTERVELRGVGDARIPVGDLRVQGRGDRRFRRAPRCLVGGAPL
ncbi:MAG: DUF2877 domain-containing protein [Solirubrobacterales bacterium]|nr:DUF2877 domain-containing protein [Solirubrobacterales bacterium]